MTTALMIGPLRGKATITTNANPTMGDINVYNTLIAGTPLTMDLPQLGAGVQTTGAIMLLEKDPNDTTSNALTFRCYAGDAFSDGSTSLVITGAGFQRTLEVINVAGAPRWKVIGGIGAASTSAPTSGSGVDTESEEEIVDTVIEVLAQDQAAAPASTRFAQQLPTGTGYGGYGDGAYGYGH